MKCQIRRTRSVLLCVSLLVISLAFLWLLQQPLLSYTCFDSRKYSFHNGCLMLLSVVRMVDQSLPLKITLINVHDLEFSAQCSVTVYSVSLLSGQCKLLFWTVSTLMQIDLKILFIQYQHFHWLTKVCRQYWNTIFPSMEILSNLNSLLPPGKD